MGWSEKIDCRANGEIVFYWMIPLTSKDSKNVLPQRLPQDLRMKKGGVEIELEILRDDLSSPVKKRSNGCGGDDEKNHFFSSTH
jgi:hypothetical protein